AVAVIFRHHAICTCFPYTTLFRSAGGDVDLGAVGEEPGGDHLADAAGSPGHDDDLVAHREEVVDRQLRHASVLRDGVVQASPFVLDAGRRAAAGRAGSTAAARCRIVAGHRSHRTEGRPWTSPTTSSSSPARPAASARRSPGGSPGPAPASS